MHPPPNDHLTHFVVIQFATPEYRRWLEDAINSEAAYGISPQVLASLIRISTHSRIFVSPSSLSEAVRFCDVLLEGENCMVVQPGE